MAFLTYADRVAETTTTTGTGTIQLGGAVDGKFRTFVAGAGSGNTVPYVMVHRTANEWEVGYGVVTSGSPDTLTRAGVYSSSNGGSAVNFSAGTKDVFLGLPAGKTITFNAAGTQMTIPLGSASAPSLAFSGDLNTGLYSPTADTIAMATGGNEVWRATSDRYFRLASGSLGIQFNGDTAAANALDDYEEGTFTPSLLFGGAGTGITYSTRIGYYTKIGNVVLYSCNINLSSKGSATGNATVSGLPFTASNAPALFPDGVLRAVAGLTFTAPAYASVVKNTTLAELLDNNAGTQQALTDADFTGTTEITFTGIYYV